MEKGANDMDMTIKEMLDYVAAVDAAGITLTPSGRGAACLILEKREGWTLAHKMMLDRIHGGEEVLPHKLRKLVARTRLGDALELARKLARGHIRNQKAKARRRAARARRAA